MKENNKNGLQKQGFHARNKHQGRYDFDALTEKYGALASYVHKNKFGNHSIDFFNPDAVKALNKALLNYYYNIGFWHIPDNYLCPPIPGRADYIHNIADVLCTRNNKNIPFGPRIVCLDIGVGANCIYPIIGNNEYGWSFIGSDIDRKALDAAQNNVDMNPSLKGKVSLRFQPDSSKKFYGILQKGEKVDLTVCNPPFHTSAEEASKGSLRKNSNLKRKPVHKAVLNFGGKNNELWTKGGEKDFIGSMIRESVYFKESCCWFSSLVSKKDTLSSVYKVLKNARATTYRTIPMGQGNKTSRLLVWSFLTTKEMEDWAMERWS